MVAGMRFPHFPGGSCRGDVDVNRADSYPALALDPRERGGPAASLLQLDIRVVAQPHQLAHPPAFEPEAAVLEGIRWLIDQDPLTVANRLIVYRASFRWSS
jgi:hypothetical protein